jgi:hypothetical protein
LVEILGSYQAHLGVYYEKLLVISESMVFYPKKVDQKISSLRKDGFS